MNTAILARRIPAALLGALIMGCAKQGSEAMPGSGGERTGATPAAAAGATPRAGEWRPLIDPSMSAWRGYRERSVPAGWSVANGELTKSGPIGDLLSRDQFGDFEVEFDWKLSAGGNAGFFYRGTEEYDKIYWSAVEYQLLDDAGHRDGGNRLTSAAAVYGLYPAPAGVVKPAGEWNHARIVARGPRVEHWLNGRLMAEYDVSSAEWAAKIAGSKFTPYPNFARASRGHLAFQGDHEGTLAIRNLRIRELTGGSR